MQWQSPPLSPAATQTKCGHSTSHRRQHKTQAYGIRMAGGVDVESLPPNLRPLLAAWGAQIPKHTSPPAPFPFPQKVKRNINPPRGVKTGLPKPPTPALPGSPIALSPPTPAVSLFHQVKDGSAKRGLKETLLKKHKHKTITPSAREKKRKLNENTLFRANRPLPLMLSCFRCSALCPPVQSHSHGLPPWVCWFVRTLALASPRVVRATTLSPLSSNPRLWAHLRVGDGES